MKRNQTISLASLFLAGALLTGCSMTETNSDKSKESQEEIPTVTKDTMAEKKNVVTEPSEVKKEEIIEVVAYEYFYEREEITVKKGEKIKLIFKNEGEMVHDWVINEIAVSDSVSEDRGNKQNNHNEHKHSAHDSDHDHNFDLHVSAQAGETDTIEFVADELGTFTFYCSVAGHQYLGMEGKINVVE
jgi:uncharacterized cupredoxin-like copper-binding protein